MLKVKNSTFVKNNFSYYFMNCFINKKLSFLLLFLMINSNIFSQESNDDCTFDLKTQNDGFLKGIKELKNYYWNQKNKTATIKISNQETINIFRGGCYDFLLKAEFQVPKTITFKKNKKYILNRILWISKLIYEEIDHLEIERCLLKNQISISESDPSDIHINLLSTKIYNSHTIFYNSKNKKFNTFSIEYFTN